MPLQEVIMIPIVQIIKLWVEEFKPFDKDTKSESLESKLF